MMDKVFVLVWFLYIEAMKSVYFISKGEVCDIFYEDGHLVLPIHAKNGGEVAEPATEVVLDAYLMGLLAAKLKRQAKLAVRDGRVSQPSPGPAVAA
jgi:hypothetical protein